MARINLLPWRAERRKIRQREFFMQLGAAALAAIGVLVLWWFWMDMRIDNQNDRNAYLQDQIKQVDARLEKIKDLEKVRAQLLARKQIIEQLQANRAQMVHLFDELVKTIPSSVRLTSIKQNGDQMVLAGVAQSNASVADYMRNIETSPWMGQSDLSKTENSHDSARMPFSFGLTVMLSKPKDDGAGQGLGGASLNDTAALAQFKPMGAAMKAANAPASSGTSAKAAAQLHAEAAPWRATGDKMKAAEKASPVTTAAPAQTASAPAKGGDK